MNTTGRLSYLSRAIDFAPVSTAIGLSSDALEAHNRDERYFNAPARWGDARQHPGHFLRVREAEDHFVHKLVVSDGAGYRRECSVRGHGGNKASE